MGFQIAPPREVVGSRTAKGAFTALLRMGVVYGLGGAAAVVLSHLLTPADYGIYATVATLTAVPPLLILGLSLAFLASPTPVNDEEVDAAFWVFFLFMAAVAAVTCTIALVGPVGHTVRLLLLCLSAWLLVTPFRFPSEFRLYRAIRAGRVALIEAAELASYQSTVIVCATAGLGAKSFGFGLLAGVIAATLCSQMLSRWRPGRPSLRPALPWLRASLPFQTQTWLVLAKDRLTLPALALVAGTAVTGWFGWAYMIAAIPATLAALAGQSLFPGFSHLRNERQALAEAVSLATRLLGVAIFGFSAVVAGSIQPIITVVFSPRWLPAVHSFWLLAVASAVMATLVPLLQLAQADGRIGRANRWQLLYTLIIWCVGIPLASLLGGGGLSLSYAVASLASAYLAYRSSKQRYDLSILGALVRYGMAAAAAAAAAYATANLIVTDGPFAVVAALFAGLGAYLLLLILLARRQLLSDLREMWKLVQASERELVTV
jgi:O-antigen/teichoic acid export membrane protein